MKRLEDYERANLAAWSFDFEAANALFKRVAKDRLRHHDLLGAIGAVESESVTRELIPQRWARIDEGGTEEEREGMIVNDLFSELTTESDRTLRLRNIIVEKQKDMGKRFKGHKARLRQKALFGDLSNVSSEPQVGVLTTHVSGGWFMAVQRLASFCLGRAYRRDGLVPDLPSLWRNLGQEGFRIADSDERCIEISFEPFIVEVWVDGMVCCIVPSRYEDDILPALKRIASQYDRTVDTEPA
jgi:hypothetical protein